MGDSPAYEAWQRAHGEHLEQQYLELLQRLGEHYERAGEYVQAQRCAQRQLDLDPLREEGQRRLMRALALGGDRNAALARYQALCATLAQELGVDPAPETTALYEQIRSGALAAPRRAPAEPSQGSLAQGDREIPTAEAVSPLITEPSPPLFVARQEELAQLESWLGETLRGQGRVGFVVGEPGSGKTMVVREFARRAMETHPDLVVAGGNCNAYVGMGDPYLPFVETLRLLTGDVEGLLAAGALRRENARRLQEIAPETLREVLQQGAALVDVLLPGAALLERARALPDGSAWEARVQQLLDHRTPAPTQAFLFDQATRLLQTLAARHPLLIVLDDLQWADSASISLLFHLGRRLAGYRLLVLGAYRPEEVAGTRAEQPHPLQAVLREFQRTWGRTHVDLDQAGSKAFVAALLDSEPNRLGAEFREALRRHTGGHALFTVELLRGLQERGGLRRDDAGYWVEGPSLDWDKLPERVEAVIAERIERLPSQEQELLSVASVEGEEFHAEVAARVLGLHEAQALAALSGPLSRQHHLVAAHSLHRAGEQVFSRFRFQHHLFQRYLYQRLDPVQRAHLHGEVAQALEALGASPTGAPDPLNTFEMLADNCSDLFTGPETGRLGSDTGLALGRVWADGKGHPLALSRRQKGNVVDFCLR